MERIDGIRVRNGGAGDLPFLRSMLVEAACWRRPPGTAPDESVLTRPELAKLLANWGRPGDSALLALGPDARPLGAGWYRFWSATDHSYGFVDESTPELGLAVRPGWRGKGVGSLLLAGLMTSARVAGIPRLSLSVEPDNPARRLYERHGFHKVDTNGGAWTMIAATATSPLPRSREV